ncbi:molecular chaperone DjiA [Oceanomicrobium pacificus]|uniref:DnaJ domain-containing protein n=1 Tax=Oceanomicrobium pacificus TaxID=2692916 RepID=A0A6B0TTY7_9RHOB|nr:molecular chaperone DjiA [Oceanomicrobium pacificus]MXU65255.1 DnaJ domain-containing protein [Oceanomicrobium pacificus]
MSIWSRISQALSALAAGESLSSVFERLNTPPERSIAFTIAVIALGAKMAKADGQVTRDEVQAFRQVFHINAEDEEQAARVFNLARQDVAGFEIYAQRIARMFTGNKTALQDLLEGLFHISMADGTYHPQEDEFLHQVAEIFEIPDSCFQSLRARWVPGAEKDPYTILGVAPNAPLPEVRKRWRELVRENHPDRMIARGLPEEAVKLASRRMADINRAWETISHQTVPG